MYDRADDFALQVYSYNAWQEGMEISVTHVKQKELPDYAFPDSTRPVTDLAAKPPVTQPPTAAKAASASVAGAEAAAQEANANLAEAMQEGGSTQGDAKRRRLSGEAEPSGLQSEAQRDGETDDSAAGKHLSRPASGDSGEQSGDKRKRPQASPRLRV